MALELHVTGPGLDVVRLLHQGDPELVLGRDTDSGIHLPDPQRNVSRHHLAVHVEGGQLCFVVLSEVNGVELGGDEVPPGSRGMLLPGQALTVGDYSVSVTLAEAAEPPDPWDVLRREHSAAGAGAAAEPQAPEEDPFGDWGFGTTFGDGTAYGALEASKLGPGDINAFFEGLGLDPGKLGLLSRGELEVMGRLVRIALLGLLRLRAAGPGARQERGDERALLAVKDNNPLNTDWTEQAKLEYLFGGRAAAGGYIGPDRAVRQLVDELLTHERAAGPALRGTLERTLLEFDPQVLKEVLLKGKAGLFGAARAWDAYTRYYEEQGGSVSQWAQRQIDRYFAEAYLREVQRLKGETSPR